MLIERLQWTRSWLLDVMAFPQQADAAQAVGPSPYRVRSRRRETHDTWTLRLEPVAGEGGPACVLGSSRWCTRSESARCRFPWGDSRGPLSTPSSSRVGDQGGVRGAARDPC